MLKASIALVGVAFAALAIGWIMGQDLLLYASIACSALGGIALLRTTLAERKLTPSGDGSPPGPARGRKGKQGPATRKQVKPGPSLIEEELVDEPFSSVGSVRSLSSPAGAPSLRAASGAPHPHGDPDERATDGSVVDFRSRLAAALDTSSLEDELSAGAEGDDESLDPVSRERELMRGGSLEDAYIDEDEDMLARPAIVKAPGEFESPVGAVEGDEEGVPDWIRIDDLPRIGRASAFTRGSRGPAARAPSEPPARAASTASSPTSRARSGRQPSAAPKPSAKKPAAGSKAGGGSRSASKPKEPTSRVTGGRSAAGPKRVSPTGKGKAPSKRSEPGATARKPGTARTPKPKP